MITTSPAYKDMMTKPLMQSRIEIRLSNGSRTVTLRDRDILRESVSANWRSSNNQTFCFGATYSASFNFSSFTSMETGFEGNSLMVIPTLFYRTGTNQEQEIPLGVFYCDAPKVYRTTTSYSCLDGMLKLDTNITSIVSGTIYNMLVFGCEKCGVVLGNTSSQIASMVNGTQTVYIDPKYVTTWREAVSYMAMLLGGYAQFGRDGKLYIRQFHTTPDMTLLKKRRTSSAFAGYKTVFSGVKCRFLANENFYPYEEIDSHASVGVIMDLGDIPIVQASIEAKQAILARIYGVLSQLEYYPCEIGMAGDPSIEAGDMIETPDAEGYMKNVLLTSVTFNWRKECHIVSEGANPKMSKVSTSAKKTSKAIDNTAKNSTIVTATYVNANEITVTGSGETDISYLRFVTNKELTAIFGAEIPIYSSGDGIIRITYANSGIEGDVVRARVHEGYNLITLVNHLHYNESEVVLLTLSAETEAIGAGSAPTVVISPDTIRTYVFAQGIETEAPWDGIIVISESIEAVETAMAVQGLTETLAVYITSDDQSAFSAVVEAVQTGMQTQELSDTMVVTFEYGDQIWRCGMGNRAGLSRVFAPWTS